MMFKQMQLSSKDIAEKLEIDEQKVIQIQKIVQLNANTSFHALAPEIKSKVK